MTRKTGKKRGGSKPKPKTFPSSGLPDSVAPPPPVEPEAGAVDVLLTVDVLLNILRRLSLVDLLRAALVCHYWRRVAARCIPRTPPLLGYFFHPAKPSLRPPLRETSRTYYEPVFAPLSASSPSLSLEFSPDVSRYKLFDCHQGLLLLEPTASIPKVIHPRLLVLDPATHRRALLPPPPKDTVPDDRRWRSSRFYVGSALLSRAHPSKLCFEAVCFAIDGGHPRAWVASVDNGDCSWRALSRDIDVLVDFDPYWFESRCVHAAGKMYWHICSSRRVLVLDPATLQFSYLVAPDGLPDGCKFRIGETPDGQLCIVTVEEQVMQLWVRGETGYSDNGWVLEREMDLSQGVRHGAVSAQGHAQQDTEHLCHRHGRGAEKESVHPDVGLRALLVRSEDSQAGAPGDESWQGLRAPDLRLLPGMAACVPCSSLIMADGFV